MPNEAWFWLGLGALDWLPYRDRMEDFQSAFPAGLAAAVWLPFAVVEDPGAVIAKRS